jgi:hypothetical protein
MMRVLRHSLFYKGFIEQALPYVQDMALPYIPCNGIQQKGAETLFNGMQAPLWVAYAAISTYDNVVLRLFMALF